MSAAGEQEVTAISKQKRTRINHQIRVPEIRLIAADGEQIGVVKLEEALTRAKEVGLDLVEVVPAAEPPVCRIMDFGKYKFQQSKKNTAQKKKQRSGGSKEVKFRPATDIADYNVKIKKIVGFLEDGRKVKITVRFRGREMAHRELGLELLSRVQRDIAEEAQVEAEPKLEGRQLTMLVAPMRKT